ncbi:beta-lactamase family protein [Ideonella sp. 4Y16]|uniref:Beta-lactamase family protein n=1 Tax=Ideonella alba TaxID=2824118 RepID=A0A940YH09_9BURK|nr:serine hydrolase domain-containing protein [Ideonella alba]MBQ0932360.1 beta-lactamase family protein [Ideonella alba]MBQ0944510.1 beta-lactamase family protein [Ideonella alba]
MLLSACITAWAGAVQAQASSTAPPITRARLWQVVNTAQAQGFAGEVLVADADSVWFEQAVGLARRQPDVAHQPGAVWRWGSVSKQVTVTLAMQQVDAGRLALDDTLARRWPAFQAPGAAQITVRHLMQHTSGLAHTDDSPRDADGVWSFYRRKGPPWQPEALRFCAGPAKAVPGERFLYGDCDTLVLAGLLEQVTGQPLRQLLQQRLAKPLGLASLRLNEGRTRAMAVAMDAKGQPVPQPVMATYGAAGAMEGTARDLLTFNRALLAGRLVSASSRQAMWTGEPKWGYAGLGVWAFAAPIAGCAEPLDLVERRGYVGGIQARNIIVPARGISVVVFSNQADFDFGEIWQGKGLSHDVLAAALCASAQGAG